MVTRILMVDDSADDTDLMLRSLRKGGHDIFIERVETPEAMDSALMRAGWDLVISDYSMPRFDGLSALRLVQGKQIDLPFILVSGTVGEDIAVEAIKAGAHDYVLKSNLARLPHAVERALSDAQARRDQKLAEARYRELFNSVPVGIFTTTPEGGILEANPAIVQMLGFADAEALKRVNRGELWVEPEERENIRRILARDGTVRNVEVQFRRPDGKIIWCEESIRAVYDAAAELVRYEGIAVDITERKLAQKALQESQRRLSIASSAAGLGVFEWDIAADRALFENHRCYEIFGRNVEQGPINLAEFRDKLIHQDDLRGFVSDMEETVQRGTGSSTFRIRRQNDGELRYVETFGSVENTDDGTPRRVVGVFVDITERRRAETEREEMLARAESARREAEHAAQVKDQFLTRMSHELRTPLNAVLGITELQLMADALTPEQRRQATIVQSNGELLLTIVNDILDFSKVSAGAVTFEQLDFDLIELIESIIDSFAPAALKQQIELAFYLERDVPTNLLGDPSRTRQILNNLLANALKFTSEGEVLVHVMTAEVSEKELALRFEVRDTGIGIPPDVQSRLFQPFVQADESTSRRYGGTGLGLAISAQLVHTMGGSIGLESASGKGSTFHFTLPYAKGPDKVPSWMIIPADLESKFKCLRALIVDDAEVSRSVLSRYLGLWGVQNQALASGTAALDQLSLIPPGDLKNTVVLTDDAMRGISGRGLARTIRDDPRTADVGIILMSSEADGATAGVDFTIAKPVHPAELFKRLGETCFARERRASTVIANGSLGARGAAKFESDTPVRILVIEDNATNRAVLRGQLGALGHAVEIAEEARSGLELLSRAQYDVVLMDCEMPDMDGYQATAEIRRREGVDRHTTIIGVTAHAMEGQRERCLQAGMDDYVTKPLRLRELADVIDRRTRGSAPDRHR
jgi:PAS domain S-box-containing protein